MYRPHRRSTFHLLQRLTVLVLAILLSACGSRTKTRTQNDVEELRLAYKDGKMKSLLKIIEIYEDPDQPIAVRAAAARALGESRHPKAITTLAKAVSDAGAIDINIMLVSVDVLSEIRTHTTARAFVSGLRSTDAKLTELRTKMIEGLEKVANQDYIQVLIDLYQISRESQIRTEQMVTRALGKIGDKRAIPALIKIATDPNVEPGTRAMAMEILAKKRTPEVVNMFAMLMGDPGTSLQMRNFALQAMGDIKEERLIMGLLESYQIAKKEYYALLGTLLGALGEFDDPAIKPTMVEIAVSPDFPPNFRRQSMANLAKFKDPQVLDRIIPMLEDPENYIYLDTIKELTESLAPGRESSERIRRAQLTAARSWGQ